MVAVKPPPVAPPDWQIYGRRRAAMLRMSGGQDSAGTQCRAAIRIEGASVAHNGTQESRERWAQEAYSVLLGVARSYHAVITYKELGTEVQERSGIHTRAPLQYWIGSVLGKVVHEARRRGDPLLTALVVHSDEGWWARATRKFLRSRDSYQCTRCWTVNSMPLRRGSTVTGVSAQLCLQAEGCLPLRPGTRRPSSVGAPALLSRRLYAAAASSNSRQLASATPAARRELYRGLPLNPFTCGFSVTRCSRGTPGGTGPRERPVATRIRVTAAPPGSAVMCSSHF